MSMEWMNAKEEAILFAKEKVEDAGEAIGEILPETAEELVWIGGILGKELILLRTERSLQSSLVEEKGGVI